MYGRSSAIGSHSCRLIQKAYSVGPIRIDRKKTNGIARNTYAHIHLRRSNVSRMLSPVRNSRFDHLCAGYQQQIWVVMLSTTSHACWHLPNHYDCHAEQGRMAASKHLNFGRHHASRIGDWFDRDAQQAVPWGPSECGPSTSRIRTRSA